MGQSPLLFYIESSNSRVLAMAVGPFYEDVSKILRKLELNRKSGLVVEADLKVNLLCIAPHFAKPFS